MTMFISTAFDTFWIKYLSWMKIQFPTLLFSSQHIIYSYYLKKQQRGTLLNKIIINNNKNLKKGSIYEPLKNIIKLNVTYLCIILTTLITGVVYNMQMSKMRDTQKRRRKIITLLQNKKWWHKLFHCESNPLPNNQFSYKDTIQCSYSQ